MTVVEHPTSHPPPPRQRALPILATYLLAAAIVWACLGSAVEAGDPLYVVQLTLCAAAGPLYLITASATGLTETRYTVVGPLVGAACLLVWLVAVLWVAALRRVPALVHLLAAVLWLFCGVMLLLVTGSK